MSEIRTIAEIEKDNEKLSKMYAQKVEKSARYTHAVVEDEGWVIDPEVAKQVLKSIKPEYSQIECKRYYFINDKYDAAIVGVDSKNIGLFTADIPKEVAVAVDDPYTLKETLKTFETASSSIKRIRIIGNTVLIIIFAAITSAVFLFVGRTKIALYALIGSAVAGLIVSLINVGGSKDGV